MAVHPQVQALLDQLDAFGLPSLSALGVDDLRSITHQLSKERGPGPDIDEVRDLPIPARLYRPANSNGVAVVFHGGGWVIGSVDSYDATARHLADASGAAVVSVEYRLAPEHPFPAAVDDAWAATQWVAAHGDELGVDTSRLVVGGDSAGANLAAVVSLMARDAGGPPIRLQALIYPAVDLRMAYPSIDENGTGYFLTKTDMQWFFDQYGVGTAARADDWRLSPILAADHRNLPPAIVITAGYDPLRDEGVAYAEALEAAGVVVDHRHYPDMIHGFFTIRGSVDAAEDAQKAVAAAIRDAVSA